MRLAGGEILPVSRGRTPGAPASSVAAASSSQTAFHGSGRGARHCRASWRVDGMCESARAL